MHRNTNGSCLIGNGTGDCLPNPPGRICREFVSLCIVELVHSADQTGVALLNQIQNMQTAAGILFCDGYDKTEVCFGELILCGHVAFRDALGKLLFFFHGKQRNLPDFLQIHPDRIVQIEFCCQFDRVYQRLFFNFVSRNIVDVFNELLDGVRIGFRGNDLNSHGFKGIIYLFDFFNREIQLLQRGKQFGGGKHSIMAALVDQTGQRRHEFFIDFSVFIRGSHKALPCKLDLVRNLIHYTV